MPKVVEEARSVNDLITYLLKGMSDRQVVIGPLVWQPSDGTSAKRWYFVVATAGKDHHFRCDEIVVPDNGVEGNSMRRAVIGALTRHRPIVIHEMDDELHMARLCEVLWPGERISKIRAMLEAERSSKVV
jgi:hypothetical protein